MNIALCIPFGHLFDILLERIHLVIIDDFRLGGTVLFHFQHGERALRTAAHIICRSKRAVRHR